MPMRQSPMRSLASTGLHDRIMSSAASERVAARANDPELNFGFGMTDVRPRRKVPIYVNIYINPCDNQARDDRDVSDQSTQFHERLHLPAGAGLSRALAAPAFGRTRPRRRSVVSASGRYGSAAHHLHATRARRARSAGRDRTLEVAAPVPPAGDQLDKTTED